MSVSAAKRPGAPVSSLRTTLEMIGFSHTIFALPFAILSAVIAARAWPDAATLGKILLAMVGARSAAMAHNRLADRELDGANPRTAERALPSGRLSVGYARAFLAVSVAVFLVAAASLNRLTLLLAPVALAVLFLYSYAKRFTSLSHVLLGVCLAMAPVGAWVAVRGDLGAVPVFLGLAVVFWTAGFDVIYSLQDEAHDRAVGLHSLPARLGARAALTISSAFHAVMVAMLFGAWRAAGGGWVFALGIVLTAVALAYQHAIVRPGDLLRVNAAFFTANGFVSIALAVFGIGDVMLR